MIIGTKSSKSWCLLSNIFAIFINLSIFVREYRTRRPGIPHLNKRYVTKPQTSHNNMQKTRSRYLNLERFYWGSVFALCILVFPRGFWFRFPQIWTWRFGYFAICYSSQNVEWNDFSLTQMKNGHYIFSIHRWVQMSLTPSMHIFK